MAKSRAPLVWLYALSLIAIAFIWIPAERT